jgi:Family of unknown function (DUF6361)
MPSSFAWLDYCEADRRKALDVADSFKNRDTRDELGIGTMRDAFANILFPGTTTIQTRAKYFLFVPWTYLHLEQRNRRRRFDNAQFIAEQARNEEIKLIEGLKTAGDLNGIIGIEAGKDLKRLPSNIYWYGLGIWHIRVHSGSQDEYHKRLYKLGSPMVLKPEQKEDYPERIGLNWHPGLPTRPDDFPEKASFQLSANEAEYLIERIKGIPQSLLAVLADNGELWEPVSFAWEHQMSVSNELPQYISEVQMHARNFSEIVHGAALLYNLMLAQRFHERFSQWEEKVEEYINKIATWATLISARNDAYSTWERERFWHTVKSENSAIHPRTESFINEWLNMVLSMNNPSDIVSNKKAWTMVYDRERQKGGERKKIQRATETKKERR